MFLTDFAHSLYNGDVLYVPFAVPTTIIYFSKIAAAVAHVLFFPS